MRCLIVPIRQVPVFVVAVVKGGGGRGGRGGRGGGVGGGGGGGLGGGDFVSSNLLTKRRY